MREVFDGVINLNKPVGITSQKAVNKIKNITRAKRAGHAGTLDPQATGVLLVCMGKATKITSFLMDTPKEYLVQMKLGVQTDTQDAWGKVVRTRTVPPLNHVQLKEALRSFEGELKQVPPMYSALKVKGERLYRLARRGVEIERKPRRINIAFSSLEEFTTPLVRFRIGCSSGTYARTLCHDLGEYLGCGAHLTALERTSVGDFKIKDASGFKKLEELAEKDRMKDAVIPMDRALSFLPVLTLEEKFIDQVLHGAAVKAGWAAENRGNFLPGDVVCVKSTDDKLLAVGEALLSSEEIQRLEGDIQALKMKRVLAAIQP